MALAFISYRREDVGPAAQGIYAQMKAHFGSGQLFMDLNSIPAGADWPVQLKERVESASGMLVLMGENWMYATDKWGRRRIDLPGDWVTTEIKTALERGIPIIPVLIGESTSAFPCEALPPCIEELGYKQAVFLRPKSWVQDIGNIISLAKDQFGLAERPELRGIIGPHPDARKARLPSIESSILDEFIKKHPGWEPWEDSLPREYPATRTELRKIFTFDSFRDSIAFMNQASEYFDKRGHHPRWSNEWRLVVVSLTTWDAKNKITERDLEVADGLDNLYAEFKSIHRVT
jgi:pterin-4a-carbinolamine dehydratase